MASRDQKLSRFVRLRSAAGLCAPGTPLSGAEIKTDRFAIRRHKKHAAASVVDLVNTFKISVEVLTCLSNL